jgi:DNA polymerase-3 subunit delta'
MRWEEIPEAERVRPLWEGLLRVQRIPQAFLWVGKEGIGKTALAWAASQSLLCPSTAPPCGECPNCQKVAHLTHPNLYLIAPTSAATSPEEATQRLTQALLQNPFLSLSEFQSLLKSSTLSIGVETVRRLQSALLLTPAENTWRVVWFWHAETLTRQAANALLKIIEEPPPQTVFFFLATRLEALPVTIRSRTQMWSIAPLSEGTLLAYAEGAKDDKEARLWVRLAEGSLSRLRQLREPAWQELLQTTRLWLSYCLQPHLAQDWMSLIDTLGRNPLLPEALRLSMTLVQQNPTLSFSQKAYALNRLLEALDALSGHLQPAIVLSWLTSDLLQNWAAPPLTWEFLLSS